MGGDHAPAQVLQGASQAAAEYGIEVSVVGLPSAVQPLLDQHPLLRLVPCTQTITMDDHPAQAVRSKPDSSMGVCARQCKAGKADGWVSAGNSGAIMATALFVQGRGALRRELLPLAVNVNDIAVRGLSVDELGRLRALLGKLQAGLDSDPGA